MDSEEVEAAARAIYAVEYSEDHYPFDKESSDIKELLRAQARAALKAAASVRNNKNNIVRCPMTPLSLDPTGW